MKSVRILMLLAFGLLIVQGSFADQEYRSSSDNAIPVNQVKGYSPPVLINPIKPVRMAINHHEIEGYITFEILVNEEGRVEQAKVLYRTSGLAVRNAIDAVARWKFEPAKVNGIPVKVLVAYNVPMGPVLEIFEERDYESRVFDGRLGFVF
ncbi:MAG: TonB family protein [bacterium]